MATMDNAEKNKEESTVEEETSSTTARMSSTSLNVLVKPFQRKRPMFNPEIFGTKKKRNRPLTPLKSSSSGNIQNSSSLWSSPAFKSESQKETGSTKPTSPTKESVKGVDRYMGSLSSRVKRGLYGGANGPWRRNRNIIPTKVIKEESITLMTPQAREIFATLDRLTRPVYKNNGWMSMREAEKKPFPKAGEPYGPPIGWRTPTTWNKEKVGITNMDKLVASSRESTSSTSLQSSASGGGGKVRASKMSRQHQSRAQVPSEIIESKSCLEGLDNVPKLSFVPSISEFPGPQLCSTPQHKPSKTKLKAETAVKELDFGVSKSQPAPWQSKSSRIPPAPVEYRHSQPDGLILFSKPNYKEGSSNESVTSDSQSSFTFSQPKKLGGMKLGPAGDKKKAKARGDVVVSVKGYYEHKKKFDVEPATKERKKKETPKKEKSVTPPVVGFTDFLAKQKSTSAGKWSCDICMVSNTPELTKCSACESPKPGLKPKVAEVKIPEGAVQVGGFADLIEKQKAVNADKWSCDVCMISNDAEASKCFACETPNPKAAGKKPAETPPSSDGFSNFFKKTSSSGKWTCDTCMVSNDASLVKCCSCETPNPKAPASTSVPAAEVPKYSFGTKSTVNPSSTAQISFGAKPVGETPAEAPKFVFGAPSTSESALKAPSLGFGATTSEKKSDTSISFSFGSQKVEDKPATAAPAFQVEKQAEVPKPTFAFGSGGSKPAEVLKPSTKSDSPSFNFKGVPSFTFGATDKKAAAPTFSLGGVSKPVEVQKPAAPIFSNEMTAPSFGVSSSKPSSVGPPSFSFTGGAKQEEPKTTATPFTFNGITGGPPAVNVAPTSAPSFSFGGQKPTSKRQFGGNSATPSSTLFGNQPDPPSGSNLFGGISAKTASSASFNFHGGSNTSTETKPFAFTGSQPSEPQKQTGPSFNFTAEPKSGTSLFGGSQNTSTAPTFSFKGNETQQATSASMFGSTSAEPTSTFNFGGNSSVAPATEKFSFGGNTGGNTGATFSFGGSSTGGNTGGNSTSMFSPKDSGKQSTPGPSFSFGAGSTTTGNNAGSIFGGNPTSASSFNFGGAAPAPSAPSVQPNMFENNTSTPSFNFGGSGSQPNSQLNSSFSLGGQAPQEQNSGTNIFGVGQTSSQPNVNPQGTRRKIVARRRNKQR